MAPPKFTPEQRQQHMETVAEMYLAGHSQRDIAAKIGGAQQLVSYYLRKLQKVWDAKFADKLEAQKARELARLDRLEREYWRAWERSQKDAETTKQKVKGKGDLARIEAEKTKRGQAGDPRFLEGIHHCIEMRLKIIGGFAPEKLEVYDWRAEAQKYGQNPDALLDNLFAKVANDGTTHPA